MRFQSKSLLAASLLAAALLVASAASPAIARAPTGINQPATPAPGPIAGAGLGFLVLAG